MTFILLNNYNFDVGNILIYITFFSLSFLALHSYSQDKLENQKDKTPSELKNTLNTLNSDMDKFSQEFLGGNNVFGELEKGQKEVINRLNLKQKKEEKNISQPITEDLKINEKEDENNIIKEIEIPELDKKSVFIDFPEQTGEKIKKANFSNTKKELVISYEKNQKQKNFFQKNSKIKFTKKIAIPAKANTKNFKYKALDNKIIIIFPKKK